MNKNSTLQSTFLSVDTLSLNYGAQQVFAGLDFQVNAGEIVALSGPSGCGKSSLLRVIAGLIRQSKGTITLAGRRLSGHNIFLEPGQRGIGMVFQDAALFPHLRVIENVVFGLGRRKKVESCQAQVDELLELLGIADLRSRYPHELSGGQQQRVAIARALAPRPGLLLMDEAFAGLDRLRKQELLPVLSPLIKSFSTGALIVSHDAEEAMLLADRIVMMDSGIIIQSGQANELAQAPANPAIQAYFAPLPWK